VFEMVDVGAAPAEARIPHDRGAERQVGRDALQPQLRQRRFLGAIAWSRVAPWAMTLAISES